MQQVLLVIQILVGIGLVAVVLLQHGRGADAGAAFGGGGGGGAGSVFGARGPGTLLTRLTAILATVFFLNSLGLAYYARQQSLESRSVMERFDATTETQSDVPSTGGAGAGSASDVPSAPAGAMNSGSGDGASDVPKAPSGSSNGG